MLSEVSWQCSNFSNGKVALDHLGVVREVAGPDD